MSNDEWLNPGSSRLPRRPAALARRVLSHRFAGGLVGAVALTLGLFASTHSAVRTLPPDMSTPERVRLTSLMDTASISTRAEGEFLSRREVFEYLMNHPAFAGQVVQALRFSRLRIWPTKEGLYLDEGWGTTGLFWVVYGADGTRVIYARGQHKVAILPPIYGEAVVMIDYRFAPAPDGRDLVKTAVTAFVKLDNRLLAAALALGSSIAAKKAQSEARGILKLFAKVSRAIEEDPANVYAKLREYPGVSEAELEEFRPRLRLH
ncbi:MAG TPA: hypothetical protein VEL75_22815 [Candidatus Methylomirabilis sp.]|nr:hypothetical protein [Candidatus Methylomirabilis sp.]